MKFSVFFFGFFAGLFLIFLGPFFSWGKPNFPQNFRLIKNFFGKGGGEKNKQNTPPKRSGERIFFQKGNLLKFSGPGGQNGGEKKKKNSFWPKNKFLLVAKTFGGKPLFTPHFKGGEKKN